MRLLLIVFFNIESQLYYLIYLCQHVFHRYGRKKENTKGKFSQKQTDKNDKRPKEMQLHNIKQLQTKHVNPTRTKGMITCAPKGLIYRFFMKYPLYR